MVHMRPEALGPRAAAGPSSWLAAAGRSSWARVGRRREQRLRVGVREHDEQRLLGQGGRLELEGRMASRGGDIEEELEAGAKGVVDDAGGSSGVSGVKLGSSGVTSTGGPAAEHGGPAPSMLAVPRSASGATQARVRPMPRRHVFPPGLLMDRFGRNKQKIQSLLPCVFASVQLG